MKNKNLTGIVVGVVSFFVIYFLFQQFFLKPLSFDKAMVKIASELNESCPMMVDSETRLDNVLMLPPKTFQNNYTLINLEKETVDTLEMKKFVEPNIINYVRTNPDMKYLRDNKVIVKYYYKDKNGAYLFDISVSPKQYE